MSEGSLSFEPKDLKTAEKIINQKCQDYINFLRTKKVSPMVKEAMNDDDRLMRDYDIMIERMITDFCNILGYEDEGKKYSGSGNLYLYGALGCEACESRKSQLEKDNVPYTYVDIDTLTNREVQELADKYGTSLPIEVFYEDLE